MKKRVITIIIAALLCATTTLGFVGCEDDAESDESSTISVVEQSSEPQSSEVSTESLIESSVAEQSINEVRTLTEQELEEFEEMLDGNIVDEDGSINPNNGFLTCLYSEPSEINLFWVLYNGAGISEQLSEQEKAIIDYDSGLPIFKIQTSKLNDFLRMRTGLTLDDFGDKDFFEYSEELDAYYEWHGDANVADIEINGGTVDNDGVYVIEYVNEEGYAYYNGSDHADTEGKTCVVKFTLSNDGGPKFISNLLK